MKITENYYNIVARLNKSNVMVEELKWAGKYTKPRRHFHAS